MGHALPNFPIPVLLLVLSSHLSILSRTSLERTMVADIFRDSTVGQFINFVSGGKLLPYQEEQPQFVVPKHFSVAPSRPTSDVSDASTLCGEAEKLKSGAATPATEHGRERESLDHKESRQH